MSHTFTVEMPKSIKLEDGVKLVRDRIKQKGGQYEFDGVDGYFSVMGVDGDFSVHGNSVTITITKKPFVVSNGLVERKVREYFAAA